MSNARAYLWSIGGTALRLIGMQSFAARKTILFEFVNYKICQTHLHLSLYNNLVVRLFLAFGRISPLRLRGRFFWSDTKIYEAMKRYEDMWSWFSFTLRREFSILNFGVIIIWRRQFRICCTAFSRFTFGRVMGVSIRAISSGGARGPFKIFWIDIGVTFDGAPESKVSLCWRMLMHTWIHHNECFVRCFRTYSDLDRWKGSNFFPSSKRDSSLHDGICREGKQPSMLTWWVPGPFRNPSCRHRHLLVVNGRLILRNLILKWDMTRVRLISESPMKTLVRIPQRTVSHGATIQSSNEFLIQSLSSRVLRYDHTLFLTEPIRNPYSFQQCDKLSVLAWTKAANIPVLAWK